MPEVLAIGLFFRIWRLALWIRLFWLTGLVARLRIGQGRKFGIKDLVSRSFFNTFDYRYRRVKREKGWIMNDFKVIESQEQFDEAIKDRLLREREKFSASLKDLERLKDENKALNEELAEAKKAIKGEGELRSQYDKQIEDLTGKVKGFELSQLKTRVALEEGLPFELAERLAGDDEDSVRKDAKAMCSFFQPEVVTPLKDSEDPVLDERAQAYKNLLKDLK